MDRQLHTLAKILSYALASLIRFACLTLRDRVFQLLVVAVIPLFAAKVPSDMECTFLLLYCTVFLAHRPSSSSPWL